MAVDNAAAALVDGPVAGGHGPRAALVDAAGPYSYAQLQARADAAGRALRRLGVESEHRVALCLADGVDWAAAFLGALKIGAVAVPLSTRLPRQELAPILRDARARVLVVEGDAGSQAVPLDAGPARIVGGRELVTEPSTGPLDPEPVGLDAMALWLYTSGTTGAPKAVVHCHRNLLEGHHYGVSVLGVGPDDRVFATSKLFFAYALGNALLIPLLSRASVYLHPGWVDAAAVRDVMARYMPTLFFSVPTMYARLLRERLPRESLQSVRLCVSAGEPLPAEIHRAWRDRFGVEVLDGLGATETIFMVLSNRPGASRSGSTGRPVPGTEARLLDSSGNPVPDSEPGMLWVRTPSMASGYWQRLDRSRQTFVGDWFRTGDIYSRDGDGFYTHRGREDDRFKVAGQWVVPDELEALALEHAQVMEAAAVGAEDGSGLIKAFLFVVPRAGAGGDRLAGELVARMECLPTHQRPREIRIVAELPRTATGKLQRYRLREALGALRSSPEGASAPRQDLPQESRLRGPSPRLERTT